MHWHHEWISHGRPKTGLIYDNMVRSRKDYHSAIKQCKHNEAIIRSQKMAESIVENRRDLWNEVQRFTRVQKNIPSVIDGANTPEGILDIFHGKFSSLYSSVPSSESDLKRLSERIERLLPSQTKCQDHNLVFDVDKIMQRLEAGNTDGYLGISSDCIIHGPARLNVWISLLFRAMVIHGYAPSELLIGTMSPIPKVKGLPGLSDIYRAITLISCFMKLFDYMILDNQKQALVTDNL